MLIIAPHEGQRKGTGIHTTIMPSPGVNPSTIPGKFAFECEEYLEVLTFGLVPGGVRNRGGASEQFCGAVKYEQSIQSVKVDSKNKETVFTPIHEENGMYLWLSDINSNAATPESIQNDRGVLPLEKSKKEKYGYQGDYQDDTRVRLYPSKEYVSIRDLNGREYDHVIPAKELKVGSGLEGPHFIPDYTISRSGVIPHGSTINLLGDLVTKNGSVVIRNKPEFPTGEKTWDSDRLAISPTMGGADTRVDGPINLDEAAPKWVHEKLTHENDIRENKIYSQRVLAHELYPYSVRPDLRLRDVLKEQQVLRHIQINLSSKNKIGAQGAVVNIPFVNRFVPAVEMNMRLWIESIYDEKLKKFVLQLQYEQIVFFEFNFGDNGGVTSWPHIQVNTLRKYEDLPSDQQKLIKEKFFAPKAEVGATEADLAKCPYHNGGIK